MHTLLRTGPSYVARCRSGGGRCHRMLIAHLLAAPGARGTLQQLSASIRPAAPTAEPPEASLTASIAPVTVTLADGTTVTLVEPTPRQLLRYQRAQPAAVSRTGLLGVLALAATALIAAAAACFMLFVRPMLKRLSATLAEMEQAAKDMQQAAHHVESTSQLLQSQLPATAAAVQGAAAEVQELAGSFNEAAKLLTPNRLQKRNTSSSSSSSNVVEDLGSRSNRAEVSTSSTGNGAGAPGHEAAQSNPGLDNPFNGIRDSGSGPQHQTRHNVAAVHSGINHLWSSVDDDDSSTEASRASSPSDSSRSSRSSSSKTVWDALALTVSAAAASKSGLEKLQSDLTTAGNVISMLLTPAALQGPSAAAGETASKQEEQQRQQQQVPEASAGAAAMASAAARECDQESTASDGAAATPAAAPPAAAVAAVEDESPGPLSSVDGRIRIAAGIRRSGSTAVLRSLSEEDIEHALAAVAASSSNSSSSDDSSSSSSSGRDVRGCWISDDRQVLAGTSKGAQGITAPAAAAAAAAGDNGRAAGAYAPATKAAAALGCSETSRCNGASSASRRRRRKTKKIEEDEWGLPTVMNMSSDICNTSDDDSSGSSRQSLVQQAADAPSAGGAAAAMSSSANGADRASTLAPDDLPTTPAAAAAAAAARPAGSSYLAPKGWVDLSSDCSDDDSDDEDYAGYKSNDDCYDDLDEGIIQQIRFDKDIGGSSTSGGVFAGYAASQDVHLTARPDDGISWRQLQQDPQLMRRVFCDNQEQILQADMNSISSGQQPLLQQPEAQRWRQ